MALGVAGLVEMIGCTSSSVNIRNYSSVAFYEGGDNIAKSCRLWGDAPRTGSMIGVMWLHYHSLI